MSKLAEVAERLAETRRWLDQEADRLAARLDQLERRAPKAIQNAHRLIDEQLRGLDETERMVQQWLSATAEPGAGKATPQPNRPAASPVGATSPTPVETRKESLARDPARTVVDEQHLYVENLERALKTMANELPEPHVDAAGRLATHGERARRSIRVGFWTSRAGSIGERNAGWRARCRPSPTCRVHGSRRSAARRQPRRNRNRRTPRIHRSSHASWAWSASRNHFQTFSTSTRALT